jgi:hypothetical protein
MLLDIIDSLPRLRLSSAHFQLILWLLKECGVTHVPSYSEFRKMQENLSKICSDKPKHFKSLFNNHFYVNDPCAAIKRVCPYRSSTFGPRITYMNTEFRKSSCCATYEFLSRGYFRTGIGGMAMREMERIRSVSAHANVF